MCAAGHLHQQESGHQTHSALHQIAGNAGRGADALAQQQRGIAEVTRHHDDLADHAADQRTHRALAEGLEHQRAHQRHQTLDDQRARRIVAVAQQQIGQHGADTARRGAPPRAQQPAAQQHKAVTQIYKAVHRGGDLHHHRGHTGQRRQHGGHYHRSDLFVGHGLAPHKLLSASGEKALAIAVKLYYSRNWYY